MASTWKKLVVSGSNISQLANDAGYIASVGGGIVSSSAQIQGYNTFLEFSGDNVVSSSAQVVLQSADKTGFTGATSITTLGTVTAGNVNAILPAGTISGSAQVDIHSTDGYVANEHIDHTAVSITAGAGLSGGGNIAASRTLSVNSSSMESYFSQRAYNGVTGDVTISQLGVSTIAAGAVDATMFSSTAATSISGAFTATSSSLAGRIATIEASDLVYDMDFGGDVGTGAITDAETLTITGSGGVEVTAAGNGLDIKLKTLSSFTTNNLAENTNLYYTDARVKSKLNTEGVVSSSAQLEGTFDTRYLNTSGDSVISSSAQVALGSATGNIALGTQTTGNYVASLVQGTGVTFSNNTGEGATPTINIGQSVATTANVTFATASISQNLTVGNDVVVGGNLQVNGTTTTVNSTTVEIADKFILLAAGQGGQDAVAEGGIVVEGTLAGRGAAFFYDAVSSARWAIAGDLVANSTGATPDAFMGVSYMGTDVAATAAGFNKVGNISADAISGDVWIFV